MCVCVKIVLSDSAQRVIRINSSLSALLDLSDCRGFSGCHDYVGWLPLYSVEWPVWDLFFISLWMQLYTSFVINPLSSWPGPGLMIHASYESALL